MSRRPAKLLAGIRERARAMGWAITEHGSMDRDIDLVGVPWTEDAAMGDDMLRFAFPIGPFYEWAPGSRKPCGRVAYLISRKGAHIAKPEDATGKGRWTPPIIDISLMDPRA